MRGRGECHKKHLSSNHSIGGPFFKDSNNKQVMMMNNSNININNNSLGSFFIEKKPSSN
jgi:hypothetical protein